MAIRPSAMVFGVTGMDGSHITELLIEKGYIVYGIYRRSASPNVSRLSNVLDNPNFRMICAELCDFSSVLNVVNRIRPEEIYNLAAMSHVGISFDQPIYASEVSYTGVMNILESVRTIKATDGYSPRIYQASSSEIFGDGVSFVADNDGNDEVVHGYYGDLKIVENLYQDEHTPMRPQSPYAIAKLAAHHSCRLYRESYGLDVSCGILFNHSGPRRGENFVEKKITDWVRGFKGEVARRQFGYTITHNDGVNLYMTTPCTEEVFTYPMLRLGNLDSSRDIGHSEDYVEAMWLMLQSKPDDFVVCTGETHSIKDILEEAFSHVDAKWEDCVTQDPKFMRPAEVPHLRGSCNKIKTVLGWEPKHNFKDMIKEMVHTEKPLPVAEEALM